MSVLTAKQEMFCQEYLVDVNATRAAIRAGYSEKTAEVQGPRLLGNVRVVARLSELMDARKEEMKVDQERVVAGLYEEATNPDNTGSARVQAWGHLAKHLGMFTDKLEVHNRAEHKELTQADLNRIARDLPQIMKVLRGDEDEKQ